jgi:hypothetical protein
LCSESLPRSKSLMRSCSQGLSRLYHCCIDAPSKSRAVSRRRHDTAKRAARTRVFHYSPSHGLVSRGRGAGRRLLSSRPLSSLRGSEATAAIHSYVGDASTSMDCFVAALLAMTGGGVSYSETGRDGSAPPPPSSLLREAAPSYWALAYCTALCALAQPKAAAAPMELT